MEYFIYFNRKMSYILFFLIYFNKYQKNSDIVRLLFIIIYKLMILFCYNYDRKKYVIYNRVEEQLWNIKILF